MKYFILFTFILSASQLKAQQAKAYELLRYNAKSANKTFVLQYADGYPAASYITVKQMKQTTQVFKPEDGVVEANGDLILTYKGAEIVLQQLDENNPAPTTIKAIYAIKGRKTILWFKKS